MQAAAGVTNLSLSQKNCGSVKHKVPIYPTPASSYRRSAQATRTGGLQPPLLRPTSVPIEQATPVHRTQELAAPGRRRPKHGFGGVEQPRPGRVASGCRASPLAALLPTHDVVPMAPESSVPGRWNTRSLVPRPGSRLRGWAGAPGASSTAVDVLHEVGTYVNLHAATMVHHLQQPLGGKGHTLHDPHPLPNLLSVPAPRLVPGQTQGCRGVVGCHP